MEIPPINLHDPLIMWSGEVTSKTKYVIYWGRTWGRTCLPNKERWSLAVTYLPLLGCWLWLGGSECKRLNLHRILHLVSSFPSSQCFLRDWKKCFAYVHRPLPRIRLVCTSLISLDTLGNIWVENLPLIKNFVRESMTYHVL